MGMSVPKVPTTADELDDLPDDGNRYEIIDGELFVTPAPGRRHQRVLLRLFALLDAYARALGLEVMIAPIDVRASHNSQVQPDLLVLPRHFEGREANRWEQMSRLLLAVETLSRSTKRRDRKEKKRLYLANGVREYWIVDIDARCTEVWLPDALSARVVRDTLVWQPLPDREPLRIDLVALFDEVLR
jgi:Uma2 family endonuclease